MKQSHTPTKQDRSRKTLEAMLDAAEQLLDHKSYTDISLTELVSTAGVTTGAFYRRFKSKNDLLVSLHERYLKWLDSLIIEQMDPVRWHGLAAPKRAELAAELICQLFESRAGLLRAMVVYTRQDSAAAVRPKNQPDTSQLPQYLLIGSICDRMEEATPPRERPHRDDLEFAVYSAITLARENILFPGLPMAHVLGLDPQQLRTRLERLLETALLRKGKSKS